MKMPDWKIKRIIQNMRNSKAALLPLLVWATELRYTNKKQGIGKLKMETHNGPKYCCLGVLAERYNKLHFNDNGPWWFTLGADGNELQSVISSQNLCEIFNMKADHFDQAAFYDMNDNLKMTFREISDVMFVVLWELFKYKVTSPFIAVRNHFRNLHNEHYHA